MQVIYLRRPDSLSHTLLAVFGKYSPPPSPELSCPVSTDTHRRSLFLTVLPIPVRSHAAALERGWGYRRDWLGGGRGRGSCGTKNPALLLLALGAVYGERCAGSSKHDVGGGSIHIRGCNGNCVIEIQGDGIPSSLRAFLPPAITSDIVT